MLLLQEKIMYCKYFTYEEIACKDKDNTIMLNEDALQHVMMMDEYREKKGFPITPISWYRTPSHNKKIGGAEFSQHVKALATDYEEEVTTEIIVQNIYLWGSICQKYKVTGAVFCYDWGFHLDSRVESKFKFWDYRKGGISG